MNDFRKIAAMEAYAPTDNVSELTARTNDEGWPTIFSEWLKGSRINSKDGLLIFSVGGGNLEKNVSPNLVEALNYAKKVGAKIVGVVGRALSFKQSDQGTLVIGGGLQLRFGKYFGTPPEFWLNLQHMHDLANAREEQADALERIRPLVA